MNVTDAIRAVQRPPEVNVAIAYKMKFCCHTLLRGTPLTLVSIRKIPFPITHEALSRSNIINGSLRILCVYWFNLHVFKFRRSIIKYADFIKTFGDHAEVMVIMPKT